MNEVNKLQVRLIVFAFAILVMAVVIIVAIAWLSPATSQDVIVPLVNTP